MDNPQPKKGKRPVRQNPEAQEKEQEVTEAAPVAEVDEEVAPTIVIERRQEVAEIAVEDGGHDNAITLAFATAAEYIAANIEKDRTIELEFVYDGLLFTASVEEAAE